MLLNHSSLWHMDFLPLMQWDLFQSSRADVGGASTGRREEKALLRQQKSACAKLDVTPYLYPHQFYIDLGQLLFALLILLAGLNMPT